RDFQLCAARLRVQAQLEILDQAAASGVRCGCAFHAVVGVGRVGGGTLRLRGFAGKIYCRGTLAENRRQPEGSSRGSFLPGIARESRNDSARDWCKVRAEGATGPAADCRRSGRTRTAGPNERRLDLLDSVRPAALERSVPGFPCAGGTTRWIVGHHFFSENSKPSGRLERPERFSKSPAFVHACRIFLRYVGR